MPAISRTQELPIDALDTIDTVFLSNIDGMPALGFIDQTLLPHRLVVKEVTALNSMVGAIQRLEVRGAPAIGVAAALGVYVASWHQAQTLGEKNPSLPDLLNMVHEICTVLAASRPTAVNLSWAVERMSRAACTSPTANDVLPALQREALYLRDQDLRTCQSIGTHGATLLHDGDAVLTHCNAGRLCAVRYGTATAPLYTAAEQGLRVSVYCDETRPLLQGARLTALELHAAGIPTTLICDNMSASIMRDHLVQAVFVGCDRVAANGDTANKIGTSMVALAAHYYGIPFYVCAPTSTIDLTLPNGDDIPIEQRDASEVTDLWYAQPMAPEGISVQNPAFDITDASLITAFVTEHGIVRPPFTTGLARVSLLSADQS